MQELNRTVFEGDNLYVLRTIDTEAIDLIYLDPPFNSAKFHSSPRDGQSKEKREFNDRWTLANIDWLEHNRLRCEHPNLFAQIQLAGNIHSTGMLAYLSMVAPRLIELKRVLKPTGSIYLHADNHAIHYLRVLMDSIFGSNRFQNEIIWSYGLGGSSRKQFSRKHDNLLFYSKGSQYTFEKPMIVATSQKLRGQKKGATDVWDIPSLNNMANERTGYPTQKPLALLDRILGSSSAEGDMVLDPFCGSGTTLIAAQLLHRRWCGIDASPSAVSVCMERLRAMDKEPRECVRVRSGLPQNSHAPTLQVLGKTQIDSLFQIQQGRCNLCLFKFEIPADLQPVRVASEGCGSVGHALEFQLLCPTCRDLKATCSMDSVPQRVRARPKLEDLYQVR